MTPQILQASKLTLFDVEQKFHLQQVEDADFYYGLISNGGRFVFIKLLRENPPKYELSRTYSLIDPGNALYDVLQILKRLGQLAISNSTNGKVITRSL